MSEQNSAIAEMQGHRNLLVLLFAGFVLSGIATVIVGPMLPVFIHRWSLNDSQAGLFSTVQFMAAWIGTLPSTAIPSFPASPPALLLPYPLFSSALTSLIPVPH